MTIWILSLKSVAGEEQALRGDGRAVPRLGTFQTRLASRALLKWRALTGWESHSEGNSHDLKFLR